MKIQTTSEIDPAELTLSPVERQWLRLFLAHNQSWARRYSLSMTFVVQTCLERAGFAVRRIEQIIPHPVWKFHLIRVKRSRWRSRLTAQAAMRKAFQIAGHKIPKDSISIMISGERIEVSVTVMSLRAS